jgi:hypothetical protein
MTTPSETRYVDGGDLGEHVDVALDRDVLAYLTEQRPFCHSDVGDALIKAATAKCGEWIAYSPSFAQYRYVALVTNRRVFALGLGKGAICYRLSPASYPIALQTGATEAPEIGVGWVRFPLFRPEWPAPDLPFWTLRAYVAARERR